MKSCGKCVHESRMVTFFMLVLRSLYCSHGLAVDKQYLGDNFFSLKIPHFEKAFLVFRTD